jgi:hypothetical protein
MKPIEIAPTAVKQLHHVIGWLDKRRHDELWIDDRLEQTVELRLTEMDELIRGLRVLADMLEHLASVTTQRTSAQ